MKRKRRILIVDDHPLFREGLKSIIARSPAVVVKGEAGRCREALGMALELKPDIILVDISLPDGDGVQLVRDIRMALPQVICLMVSVHKDTRHIAGSFQAGAAGYLVKESLPEQLLEALEVVSQGGHFFEGPMSPEAVERLKDLAPDGAQDDLSRYESLTKREQEVMRLLVQRLPHKTIATQLSLSPRTVETHRARIMKKLGARSNTELLQFAAGLGLISGDL